MGSFETVYVTCRLYFLASRATFTAPVFFVLFFFVFFFLLTPGDGKDSREKTTKLNTGGKIRNLSVLEG